MDSGPGDDALRLSVTPTAEGWVISVAGAIDSASAKRLREAVADAITQAERPVVTLDMREVSFMDSSGLGALIAGYKEAQRRGGVLVVHPASPPVHRLLTLTGQLERFVPRAG